MIKQIHSDEALETVIAQSDRIVIYGAGNYGLTLGKYMKHFYGISSLEYAVSDIKGYDNKDNSACVRQIEDYPLKSTVIIAISEQHQKELLENVIRLGFMDCHTLLNEYVRYMTSRLDENRLEVKDKLSFETHITEHCNLNCRGCYHFSPLADEEFLEIQEYRSDLRRIHELFGDKIERITLLGGEPLLHPELIQFIEITRDLNPKSRIEILTNGILLMGIEESFWEACKNNNINLCCTKYPIKVDYDAIEEKANEYDLHILYHNDIGAGEKTLIKYPFDVEGKQDSKESFIKCTRSNHCTTLKHGRVYPCPMRAHAHIADSFFHDLPMELSEKDSIDIYEAKTKEEILEFLTKPIPFCKYCNLSVRPAQMAWGVSKGDYAEWF